MTDFQSRLINLDNRLLIAFKVLAEELHFGRAAARLFISQPPLSQHIKRLEELVGAQLFMRTTRSVTLTSAGMVFQAHLNNLFTDMEVMLRQTKRAVEGDNGALTIGLTPAACTSPVVAALHAYRKEHPDVSLALQEIGSLDMAAALKRQSIDLGVMRPVAIDPDIQKVKVFKEPICLVVRRDDPLAQRSLVDAKLLGDLPLINYDASIAPYLNMCVRSICAHFRASPSFVQESRMPTIMTLVEAGSGVALVPRSAVQSPALRTVPLRKNPSAWAELELVMLSAGASSTATRFVKWIHELSHHMPEQPS